MDRNEREERDRMSRRRGQYDQRMDRDREEEEGRYGRTRGASRGDLYGRDESSESMYRNENERPGYNRYYRGDEQRWREQPRGAWQQDMDRGVYGGPEYGDDFGRTSDMSGYSPRSGHDQQQRFSMPQDWQRDRWEQGGRDFSESQRGMRGGMHGERGGMSRWARGSRYEEDDRGFRGRGPKDYQRSDDRIREDVCDLLTDNPQIDASDITVRVESGEVTLEGKVDTRRVKHLAEDLIDECCTGVKDIHNNLRVSRERREEKQGGREEEERGNGRRYFQQSQYGNA